MPVPSDITVLSTTAASNSPPGSETPSSIDDYLRSHASFIAQLRDKVGVGLAKNKLINGGFLVNQRAVSGTVVLAAGVYGFDRWKAGAAGCTFTFATSAGVTTLTISAGSLQQVIEGVNMQSGTYALSWTGTAQGKIGGGSYSVSGVTGSATGGSNLTIEFNTGTLSLAQLESGSVATPFEHRPFGQELALCQRYFRFISSENGRWQVNATTFTCGVNFQIPMRAAPTVARVGSPTVHDYGVAFRATSSVTPSLTSTGGHLSITTAAAGGGNSGNINDTDATNGISASAEL